MFTILRKRYELNNTDENILQDIFQFIKESYWAEEKYADIEKYSDFVKSDCTHIKE